MARSGFDQASHALCPAVLSLERKSAHQIARNIESRIFRIANRIERLRCAMDTANGLELLLLQALDTQRDTRYAGACKL